MLPQTFLLHLGYLVLIGPASAHVLTTERSFEGIALGEAIYGTLWLVTTDGSEIMCAIK